jgi:protein-disulfide isomerase
MLPPNGGSDSPSLSLAVPVGAQDHTEGPSAASVTLVMYGDYECPFTRRARTVIRAVRRQRPDAFRYVFRNFPLQDKHPHAFRAAEAAEAAAAQGKFWEMYHQLFDTPWALEDPDLTAYAAQLGLDTDRFSQDMAAHTHAGRIRADLESGTRSGVQGTPTFFVNGVYHTDLEDDPQNLIAALERAAGSIQPDARLEAPNPNRAP